MHFRVFFFASITFFYFIQEAGTPISAEWIIAVHMAAVYEFQSKIKEE